VPHTSQLLDLRFDGERNVREIMVLIVYQCYVVDGSTIPVLVPANGRCA